jgi:hypothetical protein
MLILAIIFAFKAVDENDVAARRQTSPGTITGCNDALRGGNYCSYKFAVDGNQYTGTSEAAIGTQLDATVTVCYDPQDPTMNALDDFSANGGRDRKFALLFFLVFAAQSAYVFYSISNPPNSAP